MAAAILVPRITLQRAKNENSSSVDRGKPLVYRTLPLICCVFRHVIRNVREGVFLSFDRESLARPCIFFSRSSLATHKTPSMFSVYLARNVRNDRFNVNATKKNVVFFLFTC